MGVEPKIGMVLPPTSSILIGFSIINHPFLGFLPLFLVQHPYLFSNKSFLLSRTFRVDVYFLRAATTNFQCGSMMINDFGFQYKLEPWKFHGSEMMKTEGSHYPFIGRTRS